MHTPLATLILDHQAKLGLTMPALARRLGYVNANKGSRRLRGLMAGDFAGMQNILSGLAGALQVSTETVADAVRATEDLKEQACRRAFVPHAIIVTERTVPSQITLCALTRGETALRIALDVSRPRSSYPRQALTEIGRRTDEHQLGIPFFGAVLGFVMNYDPCRAVRFDLDGRALQLRPRAVQAGTAHWTVGSRR